MPSGLSSNQLESLRDQHGPNTITTSSGDSIPRLILNQFTNPLVLVLVVAAGITFILQEFTDALVISIAVLINTVLGFIQEYKAQKSLDSLKQAVKSLVWVTRDGQRQHIDSAELLPGDLVWLYDGDKVPADGIIIQSNDLTINESMLTGESVPVIKTAASPDLPISPSSPRSLQSIRTSPRPSPKRSGGPDPEAHPQSNPESLAFKGTTIVSGSGQMIVTAIGMNTQIGQIAEQIEAGHEQPTPLEKRLTKLAHTLTIVVIVLVVIVFAYGTLTGRDWHEMFSLSVALAVSAIPEGLVIALTVILAIGMQRILQRHAVVRKMVAAETLGTVTTVCVDKTGTLTEGKMRVTQTLFTDDKAAFLANLLANDRRDPNELSRWTWAEEQIAINNKEKGERSENTVIASADVVEAWQSRPQEQKPSSSQSSRKDGASADSYPGSPARSAVRSNSVSTTSQGIPDQTQDDAATDSSTSKLRNSKLETIVSFHPRDAVIPFNSDRGFLAVRSGTTIYLSGIPEKLLDAATKDHKPSRKAITDWTHSGLRLIGFAQIKHKSQKSAIATFTQLKTQGISNNSKLTWLGLIGLEDPVRESVAPSLAAARAAGLQVKVITGDYADTAKNVLAQVGLPVTDDQVMLGSQLADIHDSVLQDEVKHITLFARTKPEQKLRIVKALQANGEVVGMMGDGVNDAPALSNADIGMVVGEASDVARETADIVLLDSNFGTILAAIEEGRGIFDNLRKIILYLLSDAFSEIIIVLGSLFLGWPIAISAVQILWVNLINDSLPTLALTVDPKSDDLLKRRPLSVNEPILNKFLYFSVGTASLISGVVSLIVFGLTYPTWGVTVAQTMVFAIVAFDSLWYVFSCRVLHKSAWSQPILANKWLVLSVIIGFGLTLSAIYLPLFNQLVGLAPLSPGQLGITLACSMLVIIVIELIKWIAIKLHHQV